MRELEAICQLAERARKPADPLFGELTAGIAATSGLHPSSLAQLVAMWAAGWQHIDLKRDSRRMPNGFAPVGQVAIVAPGNLCVATWQAMAEALLVGNRVSVRPGSGDPHAASSFRAALRRVDADLADRIQIQDFARGDRAAWSDWLRQADALLVYGGDAAIAAVLQLAGEVGFTGRVRLHGHHQSIGVLATAQLADPVGLRTAAAGWAVDALLADGRGCMSLRALWIVGPLDDAARTLLRTSLAAEFTRVAALLPPGRIDPAWQARNQLQVELHAFESAIRADRWLERGADWAMLGTSGPIAADVSATGPGARTLAVYEARDADDLARQLAPWQGKLSTVALDVAGDSLLAVLDRLGVHRTCLPGLMQAPRADRAPDGHVPFAALVRLTDRM